MTDSLQHMNLRYQRIIQGVEPYDGEGAPAEQARKYKRVEMLPRMIEQIRETSDRSAAGEVELLISLSGFSPETTVMAYEYVQPKRLLVIGTKQAIEGIDFIQSTLGLTASRFEWLSVDPSDPLEIYNGIKTVVEKYRRGSDELKFLVDITGGKKVMSASAALAASQLDLPMCYIEGIADPWLKQSAPGTDRFALLPNPTRLFGDREMDEAEHLLRHGAFAAAHERYSELANTTDRAAKARFGRDLAKCYQAWCDFDLDHLPEHMEGLTSQLSNPFYSPPSEVIGRLRTQLRFLGELDVDRSGPNLTLNFYLVGKHYEHHGRREFAILLYYRTLEHLLCRHLEGLAPGFSCGNPDWSRLHRDPSELESRYRNLSRQVYPQEGGLPWRVGLIDAALLLSAVDAKVMKRLGLGEVDALRHLRGMVEARNDSVLAHGASSVDADLTQRFGGYVLNCLRRYWRTELREPKLSDLIAQLRFVDRI
ncbi:TIGR02710 family CRISPR-associated CARF protein [Glycomyces mayteni]|uniref:TIGR02710 family CRISPR-associated CARF protein n=1 Tax=Glycomyces mayteni TaxID=543887 RepID=A0ABW2D295_9ACTN|nr:hypothetical protein GCM10025732_50530 [Glycomyces mayteni]